MGAAVSYGIEKSSESRLPPLDGTLSLPCLDNEGTIKYDKWGVPHIYAQTRKDGYRLQGFITAQHRCFQLVQTYLAMHGKLSSVIGASGKPIDIFSRTCNFTRLGRDDWEYIHNNKNKTKYEPVIDMISCYVEGINAWFTHPLFQKPVELSALILNYDPPFWTGSDVMSVGRLLGIKLSPGWGSKMVSTLLIQLVGYENAEWFCFDTEKVYQCPYQDISNKIGDFYLKLKDIGKLLESKNQPIMGIKYSYFKNKKKYTSPYQPQENDENEEKEEKETVVMDLTNGGASNAFAIGGNVTDTGKPILCSDPHLVLNIPNTFLYCHLTVECKENEQECLQWTGVQAVGMPGMVIGHNEYAAFGITVGTCDTTDIFVERFKDSKSNQYQVDGEWKECKVREEIIKIKGEQDYILNVRETHHGPILEVTDYDRGMEKGPYSHLLDTNNRRQCEQENEEYFLRYSLCASFLKTRDEMKMRYGPVEALHFILDCKNIIEAAGHCKKSCFPNLNFILADINGNYGWTTNGLIPIRQGIDTYNSQLPQPGWLSKYDWNGYIPIEELPNNINPKCGYIVSCNNNMVDPDKYPYFLGNGFSMGFRAKRASQLIDKQLINNKKITKEYMSSVQMDIYDVSAQEMITNILNKLDLFKVIENHQIKFDEKWVQITMNSIIPKEIRNNVDINVNEYYNKKINRDKAKYAWKTLNEWNFEYSEDSFGATIYDTFLLILMRRIMITGIYRGYSDPSQRMLGNDEENEEKSEEKKIDIPDDEELLKIVEKLSQNIMRNVYNKVHGQLSTFFYKRFGPIVTMLNPENENKDCWWINNYGNKENILIMTLIDCIDCIEFWSKTKDKTKWNWGSLHQLEAIHPVSAKLGQKPFNSEIYSIRGGQYTLNMCRANCNEIIENPLKVENSGTAVWRQIIDCSDWNKSKCILPLGTSGQVSSPYYQNQLKLFVDCQYIPMLWDKNNVDENMSSQLKCDPLRNIDDDKSNCQIL